MIERLNNLSKKSFKNYTGPSDGLKFKMKNLIFGYNGQGKSAFSYGIVEEFLKDKVKSAKNYRIFNKRYVDDSLILNPADKSTIKGVTANFGKKDVDAEMKIKELRNSLHDIEILDNEMIQLKQETRDEIDKIHNQKKGKVNINKKGSSIDIYEVITLYNKDLVEAKKIEPQEEILLSIRGDSTFENKKNIIDSINISAIGTITDSDLLQAVSLYTKTYANIDIPSSIIISWLNEGIKLHEEADTCKFCGSKFTYNDVRDRIDLYNKNQKQQDTLELISFKKKLQDISSQLNQLIENEENIIRALGEKSLKIAFLELVDKKIAIDSQIGILQTKIDDNETSSLLNSDVLKDFTKILDPYKRVLEEKKQKSKDLQNKINNQTTLIKGAIGLEISKNTLIQKNLLNLKIKEEKRKSVNNENTNIMQQIDILQKNKSTTIDFANHINLILKNIGVELLLTVVEDNYLLRHSDLGITLTIEDISEGEQNLLTLLFFYYELFSDKEQKQFKNVIELIVIDDPISSVDDVNKMYVIELIKNLFVLEVPQIFILTHVWEDFCYLCFGKKDGISDSYRFLEVIKDQNGSLLRIAKTNETPYRHLFKEVYAFSQKRNAHDLTDCEIYHYPNSMRKILEEFLFFKSKNNSPTATNIENIKKVFLCTQNTDHNRTKLGVLLDVCNILSHKAARNPNEIHSSAKFLMNRIKAVDKQHFESIIG